MYKRLILTTLLFAAGIASAQAAQALFSDSGARQPLAAAAVANAAGTPFYGERKLRSVRLGLHLNPAASGAAELSLPLPDGSQFSARRSASYVTASGSTVWVGRHASATPGSAAAASEETVLVVRNGKVTGTVRHEGKLYRIRAGADGSHGVGEIDANGFPRDHVEAEYRQQLSLAPQAAPVPAASAYNNIGAAATLATPVIRVMVHYTAAARAGTADIAALIDLAVAETNQGYVNSGINARIELAHAAPVNYTESGSNSTDRSRYASPDDRVMDEVHAQRNSYLADVGVLLTEGNDGCGNGAINASASSAFVAVTADCATGNYSFGHELGHLFGARHNVEEDSSTTPYAYGHGYLSPNRNWRTTMAYNCSNGCPRINYWANPNQTRDGVAMGSSTRAHDARVLGERAPVLAQFRAAPAGSAVTVTNSADYSIPDNNSSGIASPVTVASAGSAGTLTIAVNIIHPYVGDLVLELIAPDNAVYTLQSRSGGSADNIVRSFSVALGAKPRAGVWKLRVSDRAAQDTGHLESWSLTSP